jgi:hypothetical protein
VLGNDATAGWIDTWVEGPDDGLATSRTRQMCSGELMVPEQASLILDVRDSPIVVRIKAGPNNGVAVRTSDGRETCSLPQGERGIVNAFHAALEPGRHELYVSPRVGHGYLEVGVSPVFEPSEEQLAAWITTHLDREIEYSNDLKWGRLRVYKQPMGEPIKIPVAKGYCYKLFLIHRPASLATHATRRIEFEASGQLQDEDDGETVGWSARATLSFCQDRASRFVVSSSYLELGPGEVTEPEIAGHPVPAGDPADRLEVRVYRLKAPKSEPSRPADYRCDPCYETHARCMQGADSDCTRQYERCLRVEGLSKKICGRPPSRRW